MDETEKWEGYNLESNDEKKVMSIENCPRINSGLQK